MSTPSNILKLERFLPYRMSITSNKISSLIADSYRDKFALSITEWRIMAILGEYPGSSADAVCQRTQMEKSIVSRAVSKLLQRKLISREIDPDDRRRSQLTLTGTGESVYADVIPVSYAYEEALQACFSDTEREQFGRMLDKLYQQAEQVERQGPAAI